MSWSDKFPKPSSISYDAAHPAPIPIRSHRWLIAGRNPLHEQAFSNPDMASPVAAILVRTHENSPSFSFELVPRAGMEDNLFLAMEKHGVMMDGYLNNGVGVATATGLAALGITPPPARTYPLIMTLVNKENQVSVGMDGRRIMEILDHTDLLSTKPEVRDSVVEALYQEFVSMDTSRGGGGKIGNAKG